MQLKSGGMQQAACSWSSWGSSMHEAATTMRTEVSTICLLHLLSVGCMWQAQQLREGLINRLGPALFQKALGLPRQELRRILGTLRTAA